MEENMKRIFGVGFFCVSVIFNSAFSQNILINPSFEIWLDTLGVPMPLGWFTSELSFPNSATKTTDAKSGNFAVKLTAGDSSAFIITTSIARPNRTYDFSGWAKTQNFVGGSFIITLLNIFGQPIGSPILVPVTLSSSYRNYLRQLTSPDSSAFVVVAMTTIPNVTVYVDSVTLITQLFGIEENQFESSRVKELMSFEVFPNPVTSIANIKLQIVNSSMSGQGTRTTLKIYDVAGKLVMQIPISSEILRSAQNDRRQNVVWDLRDDSGKKVSAGVYFVRLSVEEKTLIRKLVLLR